MLLAPIGMPQLRDMAKKSDELTVEIEVSKLLRLAGMLYSGTAAHDSKIDVLLRFHGGPQGFPEIAGTVSGLLELTCQRCLGVLNWPLEIVFQLAVVESEADIEEVTEPFDTLLASEHGIFLAEIVEDEVLSSLPLAPVHANLADCQDSELLETKIVYEQAGTGEGHNDETMVETIQPFAELAAMLKNAAGADDADN
jgi:uncharacterized protein